MTPFNAKDRNLKVLIIDDTAFIRKIVSKSLSEMGVEDIVEVSDAGGAVRRLRSERFDLVVSDSNLPTMTGLELLRYIRNNHRLKDTPVLMLTANEDTGNAMSALRSGISDFLAKPFSAEELEGKRIKLMRNETDMKSPTDVHK